jgi:hypothetical protein
MRHDSSMYARKFLLLKMGGIDSPQDLNPLEHVKLVKRYPKVSGGVFASHHISARSPPGVLFSVRHLPYKDFPPLYLMFHLARP